MLLADHERSRVAWANVIRHIGPEPDTWSDLVGIATDMTALAGDPMAHAWKFSVLAEFAPTAQFVDIIYTRARECGVVSPDLEEIVERRLTQEFAR